MKKKIVLNSTVQHLTRLVGTSRFHPPLVTPRRTPCHTRMPVFKRWISAIYFVVSRNAVL